MAVGLRLPTGARVSSPGQVRSAGAGRTQPRVGRALNCARNVGARSEPTPPTAHYRQRSVATCQPMTGTRAPYGAHQTTLCTRGGVPPKSGTCPGLLALAPSGGPVAFRPSRYVTSATRDDPGSIWTSERHFVNSVPLGTVLSKSESPSGSKKTDFDGDPDIDSEESPRVVTLWAVFQHPHSGRLLAGHLGTTKMDRY